MDTNESSGARGLFQMRPGGPWPDGSSVLAPEMPWDARCAPPPTGCGKFIDPRRRDDLGAIYGGLAYSGFRNPAGLETYRETELCQACQDAEVDFSSLTVEQEATLERDEDWFRCHECGAWREITEVDVGVYQSNGRSATYEVCCPTWEDDYVSPPRCTVVAGCFYGDGHVGRHVAVRMTKSLCFLCGRYLWPEGQPHRCSCDRKRFIGR